MPVDTGTKVGLFLMRSSAGDLAPSRVQPCTSSTHLLVSRESDPMQGVWCIESMAELQEELLGGSPRDNSQTQKFLLCLSLEGLAPAADMGGVGSCPKL